MRFQKKQLVRINSSIDKGGRIIAVGTTSIRTLETIATLDWQINSKKGWTDIFIYPGINFKAVDALLPTFIYQNQLF